MAHPNLGDIGRSFGHIPLANSSYVFLLAANVGAVIMPWMVFYQQGAVLDKGSSRRTSERAPRHGRRGMPHAAHHGLGRAYLRRHGRTFAPRRDAPHGDGHVLCVTALRRRRRAKLLLAIAVLGAALVAALVASLAGAWGMAEVFGWAHTLNERPDRNTAKFYLTYGLPTSSGRP